MSKKIKVTPALLRDQAVKLTALGDRMDDVYGKSVVAISLIDQALDGKFANNMQFTAKKLTENLSTFSKVMYKGANVAQNAADTFENADLALAKLNLEALKELFGITADSASVNNNMDDIENAQKKRVDVDDYCSTASDGEYARLCKLSYDALKKDDPKKAFVELLNNDKYLSDQDPMKYITEDQVMLLESPSGFSAFVITDGDTSFVVFAGTNGDAGDFIADAQLTLGQASLQSTEANLIVSELAKRCDNIVVTGHSLGGYLATSVTLFNDKVSKCVAFDPPGRRDEVFHNLTNSSRVDNIKTYEAKGSAISAVGTAIGDVETLEVEQNGSFLTYNHGIKQICDALNKKGQIKSAWE